MHTSATKDITTPAYLNREQLAKRLGLSLRTVAKMVAERQLPFVRVRGRVIFSVIAVDEYLARHATTPAVH